MDNDQEYFLHTDTTKWLSLLDVYPQLLSDFEYFIKLQDLMGIFSEFNYSDLMGYSDKRLDAVYLLLRYSNKIAIEFTEFVIHNYVIKNMDDIFAKINGLEINNENIVKILQQYYIDIGEFIVKMLNVYDEIIPHEFLIGDVVNVANENLVDKISKEFRKLCRMLINCEYYQEKFIKLGLSVQNNIITHNKSVFDNITRSIINHLFTKYQPIVSNIYRFYLQIIDENIDDGIILALVEKLVDAEELVKTDSDIINYYYGVFIENNGGKISEDTIIGISQYENFIYPNENIVFNNTNYNFGTNYNNALSGKTLDNIRDIAKKYNYLVEPASSSDILKLFVTHKLVDNTQELVKMIINLMQEYRNLPGIYNIYDDTDLETAFLMVNLSNDINESYDEFLSYLMNKLNLPFTYAIEFILRIISRILSVNIIFYQENMASITINNSLEKKYSEAVIIYQAGFMDFYLFYPEHHQEFQPINIRKTINSKYEIVEV